MTGTIPASEIVQVTPNVLSAGGRALDILGLMLTENDQVPIGTVQPFSTAADVSDYFGASSSEYALALIYFNGFENSNTKPTSLLFAQYNSAAVAGWLRGGAVSGMTLAQLQDIAIGTLTMVIGGASAVGASIDLSGATSFSNAATIIQAAFDAVSASCDAGTIAGTTLTVAGAITGTFAPGQTIAGTDVTAGSYIISQIGGTPGGAGTYELSASSTVGVGVTIDAMVQPRVTYDSVSGAFVFTSVLTGTTATIAYPSTNTLATDLKLTSATGAVLSQGAAAATPAAFMDSVLDVTQNWATFMTVFDPDVSGNDNKLAFADWTNDQAKRYAYICWDVDDAPATTVPATSSLGYLLSQNNYSGTCLIGSDGDNVVNADLAAFVCGAAASIDFTQFNGRITFAFKRQDGLAPTCTNASAASNLIANGYNFYGAYATANDQFVWFYPGSVSGDFLWLDSYINQIWLNNQLQLALMVLLDSVKSIPYNAFGRSMIRAACIDPINQGLNFGAFRAGVVLSASQIAQVNAAAAGVKVSDTLYQTGWALQVVDATPQVRAARGSPPCTFWYMDGQSVQKINLTSVNVQ